MTNTADGADVGAGLTTGAAAAILWLNSDWCTYANKQS